MGHTSTYRIFLRKAGHNRIATMLDSPYHAFSQVKFTIGEEGIQDIEKKDSKSVVGGSDNSDNTRSIGMKFLLMLN